MKKKAITALAVFIAASSAFAVEFYTESFESGIGSFFLVETNESASAAFVASPAGAVTDGSMALEVTHLRSAGEVALARISNSTDTNFFSAIQNPLATRMSVDFFVPLSVVTNTSWRQVAVRLESSEGALIVQEPLAAGVEGMVTVDIDLTLLDLTAASWAQATLIFHSSAGLPRSPIYMDNFRITDEGGGGGPIIPPTDPAFYTESFEGSMPGWSTLNPTVSTAFTNAPAAAITDGIEALVISNTTGAGAGQINLLRVDKNTSPSWFAAATNFATPIISVDLHVPETSLADFWVNLSLTYQGNGPGGFSINRTVSNDLILGGDNTFTGNFTFTPAEFAGLTNSWWGQCTIEINGGSSGTLSPIYVDNIRVHDGSVALAGYDAWAAMFPGMGADNGPSDNPDGDNLNNLYEYGLGGDPTDAMSQGIAPTHFTEEDGGTTWLMYINPVLADPASGLDYYLETTTDLSGGWADAGYEIVGTDVTGGVFNYTTNRVSTAVNDSSFIRLIIEESL